MTTKKISSTAGKDVMVGFDVDLLAIKDQLCGESPRRQFIPIVGMGGIGKTTLANNAYHDQLILEVFHIGGWVTVSQTYSLEDIHSRLYQSLKPFNHESHEDETDVENPESSTKVFKEKEWGDQVYKTLKGRKYLVVVDDIWSSEVLDSLNILLPDDNNGSRVIITTRLQELATYVKDSSPHEMQLMSEDQSWNLLRQKVFIDGVCDQELENIGMAIARSCGGLPLAIVVIAGLLASLEQTRTSWQEIAKKVSSEVAAKDARFEKILSLSYTHLPHHLRRCFVYMGGFPEDHEIHVPKLVKLWIAEGLIDATTASKSLEEMAIEHLQDLIKRSLVLVGVKKSHGGMKSCSLHDLMRDLCVKKADKEKFLVYDKNVYGTFLKKFKGGSLEEVAYLRVLEVPKHRFNLQSYDRIPKQIFRMANLRYLELVYSVDIPSDISYLENLETFIIYSEAGSISLPPEIWEMPQLRHLISSFDPLPDREEEEEVEVTPICMDNLQTLSEVRNLEFTDTLVETIPNVKKLGLFYIESYDSIEDYHLEYLERLHRLEKLKVRVEWFSESYQGMLSLPHSLTKFSLSGWSFPSWDDMMKIMSSLPNLQVLKLRNSGGKDKRWETAEDEFPRLSFLLIEGSYLREWVTEPEHFPKLKQLVLHCCESLHAIPACVGEIATLELIEVKEGSTSLLDSAKRIEEEQRDMGNESLQVRYIHTNKKQMKTREKNKKKRMKKKFAGLL